MKRLVLHIGCPKCASSTLQGYLTQNPVLPLDGSKDGFLRYVAATAAPNIIQGDTAMRAALVGNAYGYVNCLPETLTEKARFASALLQIERISGPNDIVVLSCENWGFFNVVTPDFHDIINSINVPVDVFMLTRPPVDWVNSAWWQWGTWLEDDKKEDGLDHLQSINLLQLFNKWADIERVSQVSVHDISQGPIESFLAFVGASQAAPPPTARLNVATDYDLLRHMIRNKLHYQRDHSVALIEFRLNQIIEFQRKALPSIMSRPMAEKLISRDQDDNRILIDLLQKNAVAPLAKEVVRRYLDPTAYDHLPETIDFAENFGANYSDDFVRAIIDALLKLEQQATETALLSAGISNFDPVRYLELNPDVGASGMNPFEHFFRFGFKESRRLL